MNRRLKPCSVILLFFLLVCSCKNGNKDSAVSGYQQIGELTGSARKVVGSSPGEALLLCDSAEMLAVKYALTDSFDLPIAFIRANGVNALGMPDSAFSIINSQYEKRVQWFDTMALSKCLFNLGWFSLNGGHIPRAEKYFARNISLMEQAGIEKNMAGNLTLYAEVLREKGELTEAQEVLFRAVRISEKNRDTFRLAVCYAGIGAIYIGLKNMTNAQDYYKKAYQAYSDSKRQEYLSAALNDIGVSYRRTNPDSALYFYNQALSMESDSSDFMAILLYNKGNVYVDQGQCEKAREYFDSALRLCKKNNIAAGFPKVYSGYATLESKCGHDRKAEEYYTQAIRLTEEMGDIFTTLELMKSLQPVYEKTGQWNKYTKLNTEIRILDDSLLNTEKKMQVQDIAKTYEIEKKEIERQYLSTSLEKENRNSRLWLSLMVFFSIAFVVTSVMIVVNRRLKKGLESSYHILMAQYREEKKQRERAENELSNALQFTENTRKLLDYFNTKKAYLNPELKSADVMEALQLNYRELQDALEELDYQNFKSLVNYYRVQEVVTKFEDPSFDHYTIESIAKDAGFGSKTRFYSTFESVKGVKPAFYRSQINARAN
jgi:tetratricopeptide (TPR) repeat protein